jgi:hypothetical protein
MRAPVSFSSKMRLVSRWTSTVVSPTRRDTTRGFGLEADGGEGTAMRFLGWVRESFPDTLILSEEGISAADLSLRAGSPTVNAAVAPLAKAVAGLIRARRTKL